MILIAGPCVIESRDSVFSIAKSLKKYDEDETIDFYFKASFDKANRTSLESYRGPGLEDGLKIFEEIKREFGYKTLTDIHESYQVQRVVKLLMFYKFLLFCVAKQIF